MQAKVYVCLSVCLPLVSVAQMDIEGMEHPLLKMISEDESLRRLFDEVWMEIKKVWCRAHSIKLTHLLTSCYAPPLPSLPPPPAIY